MIFCLINYRRTP